MSDPIKTDSAVLSAEVSVHVQDGLQFLAGTNYRAAAHAFGQAIRIDPKQVEAHHGLVRALSEVGQFEEAVKAAEALTELTPLDPLAFASLSIARQKAGRITEAEAAAARARILEWKLQLMEPESQAKQPSRSELQPRPETGNQMHLAGENS